ncbi:MAG: hypothetical protein DME59_15145 [Verrucomicrobia bacterium]|nr:MAG: hypothetical protein DME59_15145 [Verrucomicrobiota bacterium]
MQQAEIIVLLLTAVAVLAVLAHKITLPYPIVLVVGGLALSFVSRLPPVNLNPDVVFYFILPALIYPAALFTSWRDFRRNLRPILLLATGLVLATMLAVAWIAHSIVPALPWAAAFALGAIVSPPDAVAATAIIRRLGVPHRIQVILGGESLVNDATALVALQFAIAAIVTGTFWEARRRMVSSGPPSARPWLLSQAKCPRRCFVRLQHCWQHLALRSSPNGKTDVLTAFPFC